jgi:hypothetical protein
MSAETVKGLDPRCFYCEKPASLLCDGVIGWLYGGSNSFPGKEPYPTINTGRRTGNPEKSVFKCDRPLCAAHVQESYPVFYNGEDKCTADTNDFCPGCVHEGNTLPSKDRPIITFRDLGMLRAYRDNSEPARIRKTFKVFAPEAP